MDPQPKQIKHGSEVRSRILEGANTLAKTTSVTYGPYGRNCILDRMAGLLVTKDGVTVAREIGLSDPVANLGCQVLKEACVQVNNEAGDGTTSTAILTAQVIREGHKLIAAGFDPMALARGVREAARYACEYAPHLAAEVEDQETLEQVAMISSNGDVTVSKAMAEAVMAAGEHGTVVIEDGNSTDIDLVYKDGMEIDNGAASSIFLKGETERVVEGPLVAVIGKTLSSMSDVKDVMEVASQWPDRPLLILAPHIEGEALHMMTMNDHQDVMHCVGINAPGFQFRKQDYLKDIAALAGADYIDPEFHDITNWDVEWFGAFRKATVESRKATFVAYEEATEVIEERIKEIDFEAQNAVSEFDRDRCNERRAKLTGGLVVMQVGGHTEAEMKERRARIEDSLNAVKAALESGVMPGGGTSYLALSSALKDADTEHLSEEERRGWLLLCEALKHPVRVLTVNAGFDEGDALLNRIEEARREDPEGWVGFDLTQGVIRDFSESPYIIDPTGVIVGVVRAAAGTAAMLLTLETSVTLKR